MLENKDYFLDWEELVDRPTASVAITMMSSSWTTFQWITHKKTRTEQGQHHLRLLKRFKREKSKSQSAIPSKRRAVDARTRLRAILVHVECFATNCLDTTSCMHIITAKELVTFPHTSSGTFIVAWMSSFIWASIRILLHLPLCFDAFQNFKWKLFGHILVRDTSVVMGTHTTLRDIFWTEYSAEVWVEFSCEILAAYRMKTLQCLLEDVLCDVV